MEKKYVYWVFNKALKSTPRLKKKKKEKSTNVDRRIKLSQDSHN